VTLLDFWPAPESVAACMPLDANALSDPCLLAVHQPMPLVRRSRTDAAVSQPATEYDVLAALLAPPPPGGCVVVSVVGPPGAGKSHLLRWLGLHAAGDRRHVVSLPAETTPDHLLHRLVEGLEGEEYARLREPAPAAPPPPDEAAVQDALLAHFRGALQQQRDHARAECEAAVRRNERPDPLLRAVAESHGDGLIGLLDGPTRDALFQGTEKHPSALQALVRRIVAGSSEPGAETFHPDHFTFPDVPPNRLPDPKAQRYLAKLKTNLQNDRATAAALMNEAHDRVLDQFRAPTAPEPGSPFRRLRELLLADQRDLVLLIDEPVTLAAVEGRFDTVREDAEPTGCPLRIAVAAAENPAVRVNDEFVLSELSADDPDALTDLVGAYLNAARLGLDLLTAWFGENTHNPAAGPPPFEALPDDLCEIHRAALGAFGRSRRGHSLFPFNPAAARRLAAQRSGHNLRAVVADVLHATLAYRDEFARGEFPPAGFHGFDPNELGAEMVAWLVRERGADYQRYAVLLGYWGDSPRHPEQVAIPDEVYAAFGLPPLRYDSPHATPPEPIAAETLTDIPQELAVPVEPLPDLGEPEVTKAEEVAAPEPAVGIPEEVVAFLAAAESGTGAALTALTPAVGEWLRTRNQLGDFRIVRPGNRPEVAAGNADPPKLGDDESLDFGGSESCGGRI
jgi:hypothetical protein